MTLATSGFGWVVDDDAPTKLAAGGPWEFAEQVVHGALDACAPGCCPTCDLLAERGACIGVVDHVSRAAEQWLLARLPDNLDSLPGQLLRSTLSDHRVTGSNAASLRTAGLLCDGAPLTRRYGPWLRHTAVTTDQLVELLLCAGDLQPPHELAVLVYLGGLLVDGQLPTRPAHGGGLAELMQEPDTRQARTACTIDHSITDDPGIGQLKRLLRATYAAFVQDTELQLRAG